MGFKHQEKPIKTMRIIYKGALIAQSNIDITNSPVNSKNGYSINILYITGKRKTLHRISRIITDDQYLKVHNLSRTSVSGFPIKNIFSIEIYPSSYV